VTAVQSLLLTTPCIVINERSLAIRGILYHLQHRAVSSITQEGGSVVLPTTSCIVIDQQGAAGGGIIMLVSLVALLFMNEQTMSEV
jgi:hypothetical protein